MKTDDLTLTNLACYFALVVIAIGFASLVVTALTHSEVAFKIVQATLTPIPLWVFIIILAAMADRSAGR